ncbi:MAG: PQQ-like beta-propeller repeat protein [Verrucomicrobia bacterium]|nr:PQQ-like beta-propeller repeat protein [Verrucomicrobiota bacterium]
MFIVALLAFGSARASDWPQFLGPTRNGVYPGNDLSSSWPKEGPPVLWQVPVGQGFSGPVVAQGKLVVFHRRGNEERIERLDAHDGREQWKFAYATHYVDDFGFDPGPRGTPAIADGKVFAYGADGALHCLDFATGKKIWSADCKREFGARKGFFGLACSPLVEGGAVLVNVGGTDGAGVVAFDTATGKVRWRATDDEASYSSPVAATFGGRRLAVFLTRAHLYGLDAKSGQVAFEFPFMPPIHASVTGAAPLVAGDTIFISASYNLGAAALRVKENGLEKLWASDDAISSQYASAVERGGFVYGFDGRVDTGHPSLRCVELRTGKVRWSEADVNYGTVILAGETLLILSEKGELLRVAASPEKFTLLSRAQALPFFARSHPALADGLFYARGKDKLFCVDLRKATNEKKP